MPDGGPIWSLATGERREGPPGARRRPPRPDARDLWCLPQAGPHRDAPGGDRGATGYSLRVVPPGWTRDWGPSKRRTLAVYIAGEGTIESSDGYGLVREGKPSVLRVDEEQAAVVIRAYQLAASGSTDWEVAAQTGLAKTHVSEVLTNPIYAGRLRTGEVAAIAPIVDPSLWSTVQTRRERRRTRTPGRIVKGNYALRLCCAGCGKYLFGDVGRYRHPPPTCEGFLAAKPVVRCRRARNRDGIDTRIKGHSYPQAWYEDAVGELLGKVGDLDDQAMTEVVRLYSEGLAKPDELTLARIEREREEASQRLAKTRDVAAWQATMARLDAEQQVAKQPRQQQRMAPDEVVTYLRSLPTLWNDAGPEGRQALAAALFTKLEVEGYTKMRYQLTPDAVTLGLGAALPAQTETGGHTGGFGRGERGRASLTHLQVRPRFVLENGTPAARSWPDAYRKAG